MDRVNFIVRLAFGVAACSMQATPAFAYLFPVFGNIYSASPLSRLPFGSPLLNLVGQVRRNSEILCSGTWIDQNIVLTAAHCFFDNQTERLNFDDLFFSVAGPGATTARIDLPVVRAFVPTRNPDRDPSQDFALLTIDTNSLDNAVHPVARLAHASLSEARAYAHSLSAVGFSAGFSQPNELSASSNCSIVGSLEHGWATDCSYTRGGSGGPILRLGEDGSWSIIAMMQSQLEPIFTFGPGETYDSWSWAGSNIAIPAFRIRKWVDRTLALRNRR